MALNLFGGQYNGRRVLLTGHTGFKGSWFALWLKALGAEVTGLSLDPETSLNHWDLLQLNIVDKRIDIRDASAVLNAIEAANPEVVFHLAAQPLVRRSYREPIETWSTNVMGTVNVLEACRNLDCIKAIVVVTTDKCYENQEWSWGYRENDRLGGNDPYSASKAAAELVVASYRKSFFSTPNRALLASARAGNVIGGGDWSDDRLIPDVVRSIVTGSKLEIRSPNSTRPWQHVLESLSGYLALGQKLLEGDVAAADGWNFGPETEANQTVAEVLKQLNMYWPELDWGIATSPQPHESNLLYLDSTKAKMHLGWLPIWSLAETLQATAEWYRSLAKQGPLQSREQLDQYIAAATAKGIFWCQE